jgi:ribosomal protein L14
MFWQGALPRKFANLKCKMKNVITMLKCKNGMNVQFNDNVAIVINQEAHP